MKELIKNSLILCAITLVAGVLLGTVYEVTKNPRATQEKLATDKAYKEVFDDADSFEDIDYDADELADYISGKGITSTEVVIETAVNALDTDKNVIGCVITVTSKEGYGGDIKYTVGIKKDGTINGVSVLSIGETAGLGMNAKEDKFLNQYKDKKVDAFEVTKSGASSDEQIDAISGATITTKAMTKGVNAAIIAKQMLLKDGGTENE